MCIFHYGSEITHLMLFKDLLSIFIFIKKLCLMKYMLQYFLFFFYSWFLKVFSFLWMKKLKDIFFIQNFTFKSFYDKNKYIYWEKWIDWKRIAFQVSVSISIFTISFMLLRINTNQRLFCCKEIKIFFFLYNIFIYLTRHLQK